MTTAESKEHVCFGCQRQFVTIRELAKHLAHSSREWLNNKEGK